MLIHSGLLHMCMLCMLMNVYCYKHSYNNQINISSTLQNQLNRDKQQQDTKKCSSKKDKLSLCSRHIQLFCYFSICMSVLSIVIEFSLFISLSCNQYSVRFFHISSFLFHSLLAQVLLGIYICAFPQCSLQSCSFTIFTA